MTIKSLATITLEATLKQYLALDNDVGLLCTPVAGKVIALKIMPFNAIIYCCPTADSIQLLEYHANKVDATISGTLYALLVGLNGSFTQSKLNNVVQITGDKLVGYKFCQLFAKLELDLEEKLSQFTGDSIAHKLGNIFRSSKNWGQEAATTLKLNSKEFLQEETMNLPATSEVELFYRQVGSLGSDCDCLELKIEQLQSVTTKK